MTSQTPEERPNIEETELIKFITDIVWEATDGGVKMTPSQFSHFEEPIGALTDFQKYLHQELQKAREDAQSEYKQFVLNVLDGIDIADGQCNTKAIRFALQSRIIHSELDQDKK